MMYEQEAYGETGALWSTGNSPLVDLHQTYWSPFSSDRRFSVTRLGRSFQTKQYVSSFVFAHPYHPWALVPICKNDGLLLQCRYNCEPTRPIWSYVAFRESAAWHRYIDLRWFESLIALVQPFALFSGCPWVPFCPRKNARRKDDKGWYNIYCDILYPTAHSLYPCPQARTQYAHRIILYHIISYYHSFTV